MNLNRKKILITGGSGFIGGNLKKRLLSLNVKVDTFDFNDGQNIMDKISVIKAVKNHYDLIYHLAACSGNQESLRNHDLSFKINTIGSIILMKAIVSFSPKTKIILSSSRLEYGKPKYLPVDENHPTKPTSPYGLSKLLATQMAQVFLKSSNLKYTVFRTSNVYGQHKVTKFKGYNLINYFIDLAQKNGALTIFGNGAQLRDYLYIDDLIDAFLLAANPNSDNQIYNLGYGEGISLIEMTKLITKTIGKGKIAKIGWPSDWKNVETSSYVSDISKISRELGYKPKISFANGIKKTISCS